MTIFISFSPGPYGFIGALDLSAIIKVDHIDKTIHSAEKIYTRYVTLIKDVLHKIEDNKNITKTVRARDIWEIGNQIFALKNKLSEMSLEIDDLYAHIYRDLGINRKKLEKVVILRRYIKDKRMLSDMNWGYFEKGTKRKSIELVSAKQKNATE